MAHDAADFKLQRTWWGPEQELTAAARALDPVLGALADQGLGLIGQVLAGPRADGSGLDWERIGFLAVNQSYNTLRSGLGLAFAGFYAQAWALARLALEYYVAVRYCREHPAEATAIFEKDLQAGALGRVVFADEKEWGAQFKAMRESLHPFAHQSPFGLTLPFTRESDGRIAVNIGPFASREHLREVAYELILCTAMVLAELSKWPGSSEPAWAQAVAAYRADAQDWLVGVRPPKS